MHDRQTIKPKSGSSSLSQKKQKKLREVRISPSTVCPLGQIIDRIGDKWTVLVVGYLSEQPVVRFNALMHAIPGISHRMLTLTLRGLERDGLVKRTSYPTIPPRVDYELTELGRSLKKPLSLLAKWTIVHHEIIEEAQRKYDLAQPKT
jgi:DNA-binding HxlR family transcriptional regulator